MQIWKHINSEKTKFGQTDFEILLEASTNILRWSKTIVNIKSTWYDQYYAKIKNSPFLFVTVREKGVHAPCLRTPSGYNRNAS